MCLIRVSVLPPVCHAPARMPRHPSMPCTFQYATPVCHALCSMPRTATPVASKPPKTRGCIGMSEATRFWEFRPPKSRGFGSLIFKRFVADSPRFPGLRSFGDLRSHAVSGVSFSRASFLHTGRQSEVPTFLGDSSSPSVGGRPRDVAAACCAQAFGAHLCLREGSRCPYPATACYTAAHYTPPPLTVSRHRKGARLLASR